MRGIDRYRGSTIHDRVGRSCRFTPTCSHYADDALRHRALPMALLLISWRLLRCTPRTAAGTIDEVRASRGRFVPRLFAVLLLTGLTSFLVVGTAAAVGSAPMAAGSPLMNGGCDGFVGGVPIGTLDVDHPLQVHKGQRVVVTGLAPVGIRNLPSTTGLRSTTQVKVFAIEKVAAITKTEPGTGQNFQVSRNVDNYLKYGSGVYRVDVHSVAPGGWDCSGTFYVELHGSSIAVATAIAVGAIGAIGVVASARSKEEPPSGPPGNELPPKPDETGLYDPGIAPDKLDELNAKKDRKATGLADGGTACLAGILFALIASTGAFAAAVPPSSMAPGSRRRVWVRGHPVLGFISGLVAGLGITVALQQFGLYPLTIASAIVAPLITAVLGALRGWRGRAWSVA